MVFLYRNELEQLTNDDLADLSQGKRRLELQQVRWGYQVLKKWLFYANHVLNIG